MKKKDFICRAIDGHIVPLDKTGFACCLNELTDCDILVSLSKRRDRRSNAANRYYWLINKVVSNWTIFKWGKDGFLPEELHERALVELAYTVKFDGYKCAIRSSSMDTARFCQFIDDFKQWAKEVFGVPHIPESEEAYR